jgi:hypothetical protein
MLHRGPFPSESILNFNATRDYMVRGFFQKLNQTRDPDAKDPHQYP